MVSKSPTTRLFNMIMAVTGFSVALFKPNVAVDAMGRVLVLTESDWNALADLASQTTNLPETGAFLNQWR
jgi:hypothetical protein